MLDSEVDSARGFVRLWVVATFAVLLYAWADLKLHPQLLRETQYTLEPDLRQLPDLAHWGGRLLKHGALPLLVGNALVIAGLFALLARGLLVAVRRLRGSPEEPPPISVVPGSVPTSHPPPGLR